MDDLDRNFDHAIGVNLKRLRNLRSLTLDQLADVSGVSRAMISRIERAEASPSALLLAKLCAALGTTLSDFFADADRPADPLSRHGDQPVWRDPETGYIRRAVSPAGVGSNVDIVSVRFPAGARIFFPPEPGSAGTRQYLWVLEGALDVRVGDRDYRLETGDCLFMDIAITHAFENLTAEDVRYAVIIERGA
ncbi:XRE family transcriptional regulator [Martelella alba]|uniref:XRE family transcriptional regulator n=1 Tax=Martelella alba TaxID=2590451 RepID=A0A506U794_9HYPH|nr:XRE family transcriptional regulator [Martelella alba]TPW28825.1 XRE family transcriptional regulator [Martelella alba]